MGPAEIRQYRIRQGMTQEDLADRLMVDVTTVQRWEAGRTEPNLRALQQLVNLFAKRPCQRHPLLDALLGLRVPVAVLDEFAVYQRCNSAFLNLLGFADRAEVVGHYCLDVSPIWKKVVDGQKDPTPEMLVFGDFDEMTIEDTMPVGGRMLSVTHRITALRQTDFSSMLIHEIEYDDIDPT